MIDYGMRVACSLQIAGGLHGDNGFAPTLSEWTSQVAKNA